MAITKKIHYCWFGNNPKSELIEKCISSWKLMCPDYEIIEWNENNFDINCCSYVKEAYEAKKWAFVSDYVRLWVIYNFGGIYLDTDVELIKPLDEVIQYTAFFCFENNQYINTGVGFGAIKNHSVIKVLMDDYEQCHFKNDDGSFNMLTCPVRNTVAIDYLISKIKDKSSVNIIDNIIFYPKEYFCPLNFETKKMEKTTNTIGIHWYNASWLTKKDKIKIKVKSCIKLIIGEKCYNKIKKILDSIGLW